MARARDAIVATYELAFWSRPSIANRHPAPAPTGPDALQAIVSHEWRADEGEGRSKEEAVSEAKMVPKCESIIAVKVASERKSITVAEETIVFAERGGVHAIHEGMHSTDVTESSRMAETTMAETTLAETTRAETTMAESAAAVAESAKAAPCGRR